MAVLHSSKLLPWKGIGCEQRYHLAGEYSYPAFSAHLICLHQGPPSFLEQIGNGQSHADVMSPGGIQIVPVGTACTWRHFSGTGFINVLLTAEVLQQVATDLHHHRIELLAHFGMETSV